MYDKMVPPWRVRVICLGMMLLYLIVAAGRLIAGGLPLVDPALSTARVHCSSSGCRIETNPISLLPGSDLELQSTTPRQKALLERHIREPGVKLMMFCAEMLRALSAALLFFSLAMVSRAFGRGEGFAKTLQWLRRAAMAALAWVVVQPVADTIRATSLSPLTSGREQLYVVFNGGPFLWGVLLAGAVWMSVWALEQARLTEIELGTIV